MYLIFRGFRALLYRGSTEHKQVPSLELTPIYEVSTKEGTKLDYNSTNSRIYQGYTERVERDLDKHSYLC